MRGLERWLVVRGFTAPKHTPISVFEQPYMQLPGVPSAALGALLTLEPPFETSSAVDHPLNELGGSGL
jgi:hypothetical protein